MIAILLAWGFVTYAFVVALLLMAQLLLMVRLLRNPRDMAPWYNATGTTLYVIGMLITAFMLRSLLTVGTPSTFHLASTAPAGRCVERRSRPTSR